MSKNGIKFLFLVVLVVLLVCSSVYAQNWPMVNLNKERTSWASSETILFPPLQQKTEFSVKSTGSYISLSYLTYYDGILAMAVGRYPNTLEVVDVSSGDTLWTFEVPESMASMNFTCAQNDSIIFAGGQKGLGLYAIDKWTGEQKWNKPIGSLYTQHIILDSEYAYILGDSLYCLSVHDGETIWSQNIDLQSTPAVDDMNVYAVGKYQTQIFNKMTGELLWWKTNSERTLGGITLDDQCFYTFSNDTVFARFKDSKDIKWFYKSAGDTILVTGQNTFAITDDKLCFTIEGNGSGQAELVTLNKENGGFLWDHAFPGGWLYAPTIVNGIVYIVSVDGGLYGFDLNNGSQLFYDDSQSYRSQPIVANHELYVATRYGVVVFQNHGTNVEASINEYPQNFELMQNYPNPFNPITKIKFTLPKSETVKIEVFNMVGQKIITILEKEISMGHHEVEFDGSTLSSGIYFYSIQAGSFRDIKKMILLK